MTHTFKSNQTGVLTHYIVTPIWHNTTDTPHDHALTIVNEDINGTLRVMAITHSIHHDNFKEDLLVTIWKRTIRYSTFIGSK